MNKWNIPNLLEAEIRSRDLQCIYCGASFKNASDSKKESATWEHIINDTKIITKDNIALCCYSCNASKGAKELSRWLTSKYCKDKNITPDGVAEIVRKALRASKHP